MRMLRLLGMLCLLGMLGLASRLRGGWSQEKENLVGVPVERLLDANATKVSY